LGQGKIGSGKFSKISIYSTGSCYHNDIPTGRESLLIETVDLPYSAAGAVTHHGMSQFLADGDPDTVALRTVWPGVKHKIGVGNTFGAVKLSENMILFQTA